MLFKAFSNAKALLSTICAHSRARLKQFMVTPTLTLTPTPNAWNLTRMGLHQAADAYVSVQRIFIDCLQQMMHVLLGLLRLIGGGAATKCAINTLSLSCVRASSLNGAYSAVMARLSSSHWQQCFFRRSSSLLRSAPRATACLRRR
jgi:hypothetical protein